MHGGCRRKHEGRQPPSPLAEMMSVQGVQHQLPFQNKVSGLKPLLPHSQHPRGAGGGCGTSPECDAVFPASMAKCRWALRMQMMSQAQLLPCPPWGFPHSLPYAWYCSWLGLSTFCWSLSTFCASWSSPGHALLLPPSYSQGGGCSCHCLQPVSMVSFQASVKSGNVDWQLTLAGSLSSCRMEHIRGQLNYLNFSFYIILPTSKFLLVAESTDSVTRLSGFKSCLHHFTSCVKIGQIT